tara:strand:- start:240 stop:470 length:231 start_codon:yes stop_codon:yes gene_type:complete
MTNQTDYTEHIRIKYPDVEVTLIGEDGNAFAIMGRVQRALKQHGVPKEEIEQYLKESQSGDYDNLLVTATRWVTVL